MKNYFILLCLIVSGGLASAAIQNKANPDKPPIVYVYSYFDNWTHEDGSGSFTEQTGATKNYSAIIDSARNLEYHGNGSFYYHVGEGYGWWDSSYFWSDTNKSGTFTTTGYDASGYNIDGNSVGNGDDFVPSLFAVPSESWNENYTWKLSHYYANINYRWSWPNYGEFRNFSRNARAYMKLQTGGKTGIAAKNLLRMSANATEYGRPVSLSCVGPQGDVWDGTPTTAIDPTRIRVLGKNVGNDGNLYIVLPDNATLDLAASAPGRHYSLNVTATKHKLYVQANNSILQPDHVVPTGTFSVGQKLTFSYFFNPSVSGIVDSDTGYQWILNGSLVNGWNSLGSGYDDYFFDRNMLQAAQTPAWYYSDAPNTTAYIDLDLKFSNGQKVNVYGKGRYSVVKPVAHVGSGSTHYGSFTLQGGFLWLSMGTSTNEIDDGNMEFTGDVTSKFPGAIGWTQLVNCTNESSFPLLAVSTGGNWELDGSLIYDKSYQVLNTNSFHQNIFYQKISGFTDCPGIPVGDVYTTMNSSFMTFLRFKPSSPDSIWVTLARVDWSWHAEATGTPTLVVNNVTGPTFTLSNQFPPLWYDIRTGLSIVKDEAWYLFFGL